MRRFPARAGPWASNPLKIRNQQKRGLDRIAHFCVHHPTSADASRS